MRTRIGTLPGRLLFTSQRNSCDTTTTVAVFGSGLQQRLPATKSYQQQQSSMVAERPRPSRSETGSAMARPRRSRSLREELAEAEAENNADMQDFDGNMVQ